MSKFSKWAVACSLTALGAVAGATALKVAGVMPSATLLSAAPSRIAGGPAAGGSSAEVAPSGTYIVVFREAPLASYKGETPGLQSVPKATRGPNRGRIDVHSTQAKQYVSHLESVQRGHEAKISRTLGGQMKVRKRMQHALNAIVTEVSAKDAERMRKMPEVAFVEEYREYQLEGDTGTRLIGAESIWNGTTPITSSQFRGEGVVVGIIDTGINFGSPSFAAVSSLDGYRHTNPLGTGKYIGSCAPGGVDEGRCNDKLIGGYDFVCNVAPDPSRPAETYCTQTGTYREEPGFGDTNSHGSHVGSTVAGNPRDVTFKGATVRISGVAPRANVIGYDVCFTNISTGGGSCPNVATAEAINQAVRDGIVNVLNYSIGGGTSPWSDVVSQAFLNAADAGIYIAASAGNSGPGPNTMGHHQPWVGSTAASQHGRGDFAFLMDITGPGAVPSGLQSIALNEGSGGVAHTTALPATTPLRVSPRIDTTDDGCAAFAANLFQGAIAVIRRGTCSFAIKVNNASAAGAVAVIIANNQTGLIAPSVPGTTVPAFGVTQAAGNAIRDFAVANPTATARIPYPPVPTTNTPDQLAAFSSRGPAGMFDLLKPDVTAPGVSILAAISGTTLTGSEQAVGLMNGTSMASPHHAGAAALLRQAHPTWTVPEIKSALAMTGKREVLLEDGVTMAGPFARGAGRIQVDQAIRAGLVLNEVKANYLAANPATGGDPTALNQPSLIKGGCFEKCVFRRTFRNTLPYRQAWAVKAEGMSASISPALFTVNPGESKTLTITVNATTLPANSVFQFGTLVLTPQSAGNPNQPTLRMPMAVSVRPAVATVGPGTLNVSVASGATTTATFNVGNTGGSRLNYTVDNTGNAVHTVVDGRITSAGSGFRSTRYTDTSNPPGQYAADDFTLADTTRLTSLISDGFVVSGAALTSAATQITWSIYADDNGAPAGNPETNAGAAVWTYTTTPTGAGVATSNGTIALNLNAAGQNVTLTQGRYWLVVNTRGTFANRWVWYASDSGNGSLSTITPSTGGWTTQISFPGLAWLVDGQVPCGASWIGAATPTMGQVLPGASAPVQVQIDATALSAGTYSAYACVSTSDTLRPRAAVRVALTVN